MKKLLFFMMVIGIGYVSLVQAAQQSGLRTPLARDEQIESIREVQEQIKKKHALHKILERAGMHKEAENLEREIGGLEEQLKVMEAQEGNWSGFSTYDEADDTSIVPPKISARLLPQEREALFSGGGEQGSDVRAPLSDIEDQLITEHEAEFPGLREALERSMFERGPAQGAVEPRAAAQQEEEKKTSMEEAQEEMRQAQSKPKKIKKKLSPREREVSAFLPIDLVGIVADYDVGYLWLDPLAEPIAQKLKLYKEDHVYSIAINEDGQFIVTGNHDEFTRVWRKDGKGEWQSVRELKQIGAGTPDKVAISADGQCIMTNARKSVLVWAEEMVKKVGHSSSSLSMPNWLLRLHLVQMINA